jgi:SAM-dependent methyltransferase
MPSFLAPGSPTTVREIMTPVADHVRANETVRDAAARLGKTAAIPVLGEDGSPKGTFTRGHVSVAVMMGKDTTATTVGELYTEGGAIHIDATIEEALTTMRDQQVPHLWVQDEDGLAGQITDSDCEDKLRVEQLELKREQTYRSALRELGDRAPDLIEEISPHDAMHRVILSQYLWAGASALRCMRAAILVAGKEPPASVLDFPCGYGRVLRMLKAAFPGASLTACDLDRDGVDFCARVFGAKPVYSSENADAVHIDDKFDLIWSGSLLTHLDAHHWLRFLALFDRCLAPGGLLVFTIHGHHEAEPLDEMGLTKSQISEIHRAYNQAGFGYVDYKWQKGYGIAIASPAWVSAQLRDHTDLELVNYAQRSWEPPWPRQDVIACMRRRAS